MRLLQQAFSLSSLAPCSHALRPMRKEAGGHHAWAECGGVPEPPSPASPASLPACAGMLQTFAATQRHGGVVLLAPAVAYLEGWGPESCRATCPLQRWRRCPTQLPRQLLACFPPVAGAVRSRGWDPVPCCCQRARYCFIGKIFGVWAFQLTLAS